MSMVSQKRKRKPPLEASPMIGVVKVKGRDNSCCGVSFLKTLLGIYNFILLVSGVAVVAVGIWALFVDFNFLGLHWYQTISFLLIIAGLIIILVVILGCCATYQENFCCINLFASLLMFVFLIEASAGLLAYMYESMVKDELARYLNYLMTTRYPDDPIMTRMIDTVQRKFRCCGAGSYQDWAESAWLLNQTNSTVAAPDSCCITMSAGCAVRVHPSNIYLDGCMTSLENFTREHLIILGAVGLGLCCLQIFGIVFSCCLVKKMKKWREQQKISYWR